MPLFTSLINLANPVEEVSETGLAGHWSMKTNSTTVTDETGTNDGTLASGTVTTGIIGQAIDFDGDDDYVSVEHGGELSVATAGTISVWIYPRTISGGAKFIVGTHPNQSGDDLGGYQLNIGNQIGQICFRPRATTSTCSSSSAVPANQWTHMVAVVDATSKHIYINGVEDTSSGGGVTVMPGATNYDFYIGNGSALTNDFDGKIDEVRVYSSTLSETEIAELYAQGSRKISTGGMNKGLIAHYSLAEEDLVDASTLADLTPNRQDGTITAGASAGFVADQTGVSARAYDFDGADTVIDTGTDLIDANDFTLSTWIYADSLGESNSGRIIDNGQTYIRLLTSSGRFKLNYSGNNGTNSQSTDSDLGFSEWHHIAVSREGTLYSVYFNGIFVGSKSSINTTAGSNLIIGNTADQSKTFNGKISDVRIYDRVLSSDEISTLYRSYRPQGSTGDLNKGLIAHYPLSSTNETYGVDELARYDFDSWSKSNVSSYSANSFTTSSTGYVRALNTQLSGTITSLKKYKVTAVGTTTATYLGFYPRNGSPGLESISGTFDTVFETTWGSVATPINDGIALHNGDAGTTTFTTLKVQEVQAGDITPNTRHGSIYPGASDGYVTDQKGVSGRAYDFDGADTMVDTGSTDYIGTGDVSVSAWIYLNGWGENAAANRIIQNGKFIFATTSTGTKSWVSSDGGNTFSLAAAGSLSLGQWYHVVATRTSAGIAKNYVNGMLSGTPASSGTPAAGTVNVTIGNNSTQTGTFDGLISDVRVYNRILSADEIRLLYDQKE